MKCRSVACIWSGVHPSHRVTATAVLKQPPTLYTGGSDGSIIWWNLSSSGSNPEIKPIAMLCGHAAPIVDLGICYPVVLSRNEKLDASINVLASCTDYYGALISACTDGVLCVWSRSSGHCRRRRKLPPWVGSPSIIRTLPSNARYVCIGCSFIDNVQLSERGSVDSSEGAEGSVYGEFQHRKPSKCAVVVVDSYTLTIVQTVFHGNLSIGSLKFMAVVSSIEHKEKHSVVMADSFGRLQLIPILKDPHQLGDDATGLHKSSQSEMTVWADGLSEGGQVVSIAICENVIAFVFKKHCIFRLLETGTTIGEISFSDKIVYLNGRSTHSHVIGGTFLESEESASKLNTDDFDELSTTSFIVWNNDGYAIVYSVSFLNKIFKCEALCEIPTTSHPDDARLSVCFIQLNRYLLRICSHCIYAEEPLLWKPHITIYSPHTEHDDHGKLCCMFRILGEGSFSVDWIEKPTSIHKIEDPSDGKSELSSWESSVPSPISGNNIHACYQSNKARIVSSSMVISENLFAPYAIVYGFFNGEIEVVRFDLFHGITSHGNSSHNELGSHASRQYFLGHTGAVLCLAAHRMVGTAKGWSFNQVLISGSMDCTVRIWDLETSNLITVMHQHVAPVHQIILPPSRTDRPWNDCFLSVGEDSCVALASLETLRVERMLPGHPSYPAKVVWDGVRGYIACLCRNRSRTYDASDVLYIWDVKTGARERFLRGTASHSMFDQFCKGVSMNSISGTILNGNTSVSLLSLPIIEDGSFSHSNLNSTDKLVTSSNVVPSIANIVEPNTSQAHISKGISAKSLPTALSILQSSKPSIKCYCPFPGIAALNFDLGSLMFPHQKHGRTANDSNKLDDTNVKEQANDRLSPHHMNIEDGDVNESMSTSIEELEWIRSLEECLLRFSLSYLHLWNVDCELDNLLIADMKLKRLENLVVASGLLGDKGSLTLTFPGLSTILELWKSSSEFCAMRSLTMVSLAQRMISLSYSSSAASSALAAFYTRNFAEKYPDVKPPLLQLLVSFWQDESEHVRMAARSLFHCTASRAIPLPLRSQKATDQADMSSLIGIRENEHENVNIEETSANRLHSDQLLETQGISRVEESKIHDWLESFEMQDWISCVGGTSQDAMTSHIIVAAALAIWYPSLVKPGLAMLVVHPLVKLVMAVNEKYSSTAAELLAEGMDSAWKACLGSEIPRLVGDIFFQIECVSGPSANLAAQNPVVPVAIQETLVGVLLPSLAMADIPGFLTVIESQIWSTASDSPVHLVSLTTLIRVVRSSPRNLAQYLDKVVNFILQTMDPSNSVMRKMCFQSSMTALKEVVRAFPMVTLNDTWTRLAVGDVIGEMNSANIRGMRDPELPVRVDSVFALRSFVESCRDLNEIRPILPQLLDEFFKLMNEVENEDLVFTLETIVDKFGEEMAPYALGLCQNLAAAFWRCMNTAEADDEADDPGALAAVGCLRAISTILESVSRLPHLFVQVEPTLLPIMRRMLTSDGQEVFEEVLEIVSYMTFFSPTISMDMWSLWPLMMEALADFAIDYFPNILVPLDNYISRGTARFLTCKEPDYQQSLWNMISSIMADKNMEDNDIEPAPKLIQVVFQNCKGQVDQWVEPYLRITVERLRRAEKSYLKCLLMQVIADALYYNAAMTLGILQKLGVATEIFNLWFQMLQQVRKSGVRVNFKREHDKKVCCLGLTSLLSLPADQLPGEALGRVFRATLDLLVAYKDQVAEAAKEEEAEDDDDMDGFQTDDEEDDGDVSDKEMGVDTEDGDEADSIRLQKLAEQAKAFRPNDEDDDDSDDDYSDDEELQSPIDEVDPFVFFVDTVKVLQASDPLRFQNLTQTLDFHYQALANGVAQHAEQRRAEIEKERMEKATATAAA